jgi:hypothetical protein
MIECWNENKKFQIKILVDYDPMDVESIDDWMLFSVSGFSKDFFIFGLLGLLNNSY